MPVPKKEKNKMSMPIEKDYPNSMKIMDIKEARELLKTCPKKTALRLH